MTLVRFRYPGQHITDRAYSGALAPIVRRAVRNAGINTIGENDGPVFGRKIYSQPKQVFEFRWPSLSHVEAQELYREWLNASGGTAAVYYTPDDQSHPITIVLIQPPAINYMTAGIATVSAVAEEQR
tara:strand:+ start:36515 stop:36895 length:381 start_codon:yes stop_codon:yes gene_type:complete